MLTTHRDSSHPFMKISLLFPRKQSGAAKFIAQCSQSCSGVEAACFPRGSVGRTGVSGSLAQESFVIDTCWPSHFLSTELEKQLVALIPYGDQRLKPRHT